MRPIDVRNENWAQVRERVSGVRRELYMELSRTLPCTTRELAERTGVSILTVRPRITELVEIGMVAMIRRQGTEGVYAAVSDAHAEQRYRQRQAAARRPEQMALL